MSTRALRLALIHIRTRLKCGDIDAALRAVRLLLKVLGERP